MSQLKVALSDYNMMLSHNGKLWACGENHQQLLNFDTFYHDEPYAPLHELKTPGLIQSVACDREYMAVIDSTKTVWVKGKAFDTGPHWAEVDLTGSKAESLYATGKALFIKTKSDGFFALHTLKLENLTVDLSWGSPRQPAHPSWLVDRLADSKNWDQLVYSQRFSLVLTKDGALLVAGTSPLARDFKSVLSSTSGFAPLGLMDIPVREIAASRYGIVVVDITGALTYVNTSHGDSPLRTSRYADFPSPIGSVAMGEHHLVVVLEDKTCLGLGIGSSGQLGDTRRELQEFTPLVDAPTKVNSVHAASYGTVLVTDKSLYVTGDNESGNLGLPSRFVQFEIVPLTKHLPQTLFSSLIANTQLDLPLVASLKKDWAGSVEELLATAQNITAHSA